jgi:hypothetical protein
MPFSDIITRSFEIVWRNRSLWIVGMIFAFFGGGGGGSSNFNYSQGTGSPPNADGSMPMPDLPAWFTMENIILVVGIAVVIGLVVGIISLAIQSIAHTGLIRGTESAIENQSISWRGLLGTGWRGPWQSLFWLKILIALPSLIIGIIGAIIAISVAFPLMQAAINQEEPAIGNPETFIAGFFGMFCLLFCAIFIVAIFQWVLSLAGHYAARAIVLEGKSLGNAWGQGWGLFRANMLNSFIMSILLALLLGIVGLVVTIPLLVFFAVGAIPFFAIMENINTIPPALLVIGGIALTLGVGLVTSILTGPLLAYGETVWTMTYRHITGRELPTAPAAPTPTAV